MNYIEHESIYESITRMAEHHPSLPYDFQDVESAGKRDVMHVFWGEEPPLHLKQNMAKALMDEVIACSRSPGVCPELRSMLKKVPLHMYVFQMAERMKLSVYEKLIDETEFYFWGLRLAMQSDYEEEVKLGILVLGLFDHDVGRQVIRTLGLHSTFTVYAIEALRYDRDRNAKLFEWVQQTSGYGKFAALAAFFPVHEMQKKWIFEKGSLSEVGPNMSAILCLEKADMADFYQNLEVDTASFPSLSRLIAYAAEQSNLKEFTLSLLLARKFMGVQETYAKSFLDLAAMASIKKSMAPYWIEFGKDVEKENGWSSNIESEIRISCERSLQLPKWRVIVLQELSAPCQTTSLIIAVLNVMHMIPDFADLIPLLNRDLYDMDVMEFMLIENPGWYLQHVLAYIPQVVSEAVFNGNPEAGEPGTGNLGTGEPGTGKPDTGNPDTGSGLLPDYRADIWLVFLVKALRRAHQHEEQLFLRCLTARFADLRSEAIQALRVCKTKWSDAVLPAIEKALLLEPDTKLVRKMKRLIGAPGSGSVKEQRYVDAVDIKVTPSTFDVVLLTTKIAGTVFRDLLVTEGRIEFGDILYLMREPDNAYDTNAILVTSEDGYVLGYVPKAVNAAPASMMDAGEKLYALLTSDKIDDRNPGIQIMLNRPPVKSGKIIKIPFEPGFENYRKN